MGALALSVLAATIFACSKEKESATQQPTGTETARKPIATFDNATGRMTYHVSVGQTTTRHRKALEKSSLNLGVSLMTNQARILF